MFRKIVSNLSFSPALVGQLGFYAKRLKKEQTTRRLGLVFVALALAVQALAVFQAPESANASNSGDMVPGGMMGQNESINTFLAPYDANSRNLKDVMNTFGITRDEIAAAQFGLFWTNQRLSWGYEPRPGTTAVTVYDGAGNAVNTVHGRPLAVLNGQTDIYGWIGHSAKMGWFAIMQFCGNLITEGVPPPPPPPPPPPQVIPAKIVLSKSAANISQGNVAANTITAREGDKITYTISIENTGGTAKVTELKDHLGDILEYSKLIDKGGGTFDEDKKILSWPDVNLGPGKKESRTFAVQVLDTIPATPVGQSDPSSYNCLMENKFGNDVIVPIYCAPPKVIEKVTTELPHTGPAENMLFAGVVLAVVTYFFLRSRQMNKEVRLIRRDLNAGTI